MYYVSRPRDSLRCCVTLGGEKAAIKPVQFKGSEERLSLVIGRVEFDAHFKGAFGRGARHVEPARPVRSIAHDIELRPQRLREER